MKITSSSDIYKAMYHDGISYLKLFRKRGRQSFEISYEKETSDRKWFKNNLFSSSF